MRENRTRGVQYAQPGSPHCLAAKEFLLSRDRTFEEKNVRADQKAARELIEDCESHATPKLVVGSRVLLAFDPAEYERALGAAGGCREG